VTVCFIGSGNVATHMAIRLCKAGVKIVGIYSRTIANAISLALKVSSVAIDSKSNIPDADIYICSVKDDNILDALSGIKFKENSIIVHTAGSVEISVLSPFSNNIGVIYPMQTFSKSKNVDWNNIPLYIEANSTDNLNTLLLFAKNLSNKITIASSAQRKILHLASVFVCNFTNQIYAIADRLLKENGLEFSALYPLIDETVSKIKVIDPVDAQTGPAKRDDKEVMEMQKSLLKGLDLDIYEKLSKAIQNEQLQRESKQN